MILFAPCCQRPSLPPGFIHHGDRGQLGAVVGVEWHQRLRTGDFGRKLERQGRLEGRDVGVAVPGLPQAGGSSERRLATRFRLRHRLSLEQDSGYPLSYFPASSFRYALLRVFFSLGSSFPVTRSSTLKKAHFPEGNRVSSFKCTSRPITSPA